MVTGTDSKPISGYLRSLNATMKGHRYTQLLTNGTRFQYQQCFSEWGGVGRWDVASPHQWQLSIDRVVLIDRTAMMVHAGSVQSSYGYGRGCDPVSGDVAVCVRGTKPWRYEIGYVGPRALPKQSLLLVYRPIVFTDSIDYWTVEFSHYRLNPICYKIVLRVWCTNWCTPDFYIEGKFRDQVKFFYQ